MTSNRWIEPFPIEDALVGLGVKVPIAGARSSLHDELEATEARLGTTLPEEVRLLYLSLLPEQWLARLGDEPGLFMIPLGELEVLAPKAGGEHGVGWIGQDGPSVDRWLRCSFLPLFRDRFGNSFAICLSDCDSCETEPAPGDPKFGAVVFLDHESDFPFRVMTPNLGAWIDRFVACGNYDAADFPGDEFPADLPTQADYFRCYTHFVPDDPWGHERLDQVLRQIAKRAPEVRVFDRATKRVVSLAEATEIEEITLDPHEIDGLPDLTDRHRVKRLRIVANGLVDARPIGRLTQLEELIVHDGELQLDSLAGLPSLRFALFNRCKISDLSPLGHCPALKFLKLDGSRGVDYSTIRRVTGLERLHASPVGLDSIEWFADMSDLLGLNVSWSSVTDLTPVRKLGKLQALGLAETQVVDLGPVSSLVQLEGLNIRDCAVADLSPLSRCAMLKRLSAEGSLVNDLSPLAKLIHLEELDLSSAPVSDLSPLRSLHKLRELDVAGTKIRSIEPVGLCELLEELDISETAVDSLEPLMHLRKMKWLFCRETRVPIEHVKRMRRLIPGITIYADGNV